MSARLEVLREFRQHFVSDEVVRVAKEGVDLCPVPWGCLIEGYVEDELHFEVAFDFDMGGYSRYLFAVFHGAEREGARDVALAQVHGDVLHSRSGASTAGTDDVDGLVLVVVPESVEHPENVSLARRPGGLRSLIRLQATDYLDAALDDSEERPALILTKETTGRRLRPARLKADREADVLEVDGLAGRKQRYGVGEMIQDRPQIVESVGGDESEAVWKRLDELDPEDFVTRLRLNVGHNQIWVGLEKVQSLSLKALDMAVCPREPSLSDGKVYVRHALPLEADGRERETQQADGADAKGLECPGAQP